MASLQTRGDSLFWNVSGQSKPGQSHVDRFTKPSTKLGMPSTILTGCLTLNPNYCTQRSTQSERGLVIGGGRSSSKLPEGTLTWGPTLRFLREPWLSAYPFCEQFLRLKANFANNKILLLINFNRYRFKYSESCNLGSLNPLFSE